MLGTMIKALIGGKNRNAMMDTMLEAQDAKVANLDEVIPAPEDADPRQTFTSTIPEDQLHIANMTGRQRLKVGPVMLRLGRVMGRGGKYYKRTASQAGTEAEHETFETVEAIAREHGATALRWTRIPDDAIFAGKAVPHRNVLIYAVPMETEAMDTAPSFEAFYEVAGTYLTLGRIGNALTDYLRSRGHAAYPGTSLGGLSDYTRIGEVAGLGIIGYHGLLISPEDGALLRLNVVYTSIENLPEQPPASTDWVRDFCSRCHKCVRSCPVDAIHETPIVKDNGRVECIETTTCLDFFAANYGCGVCADVCPFSQKGFDVIQARFKGNPDAPRFSIIA